MESGAPRHLWVVGILAVLWNGFGCVDYVLTQIDNDHWMGHFSAAARDFFRTFPAWADAAWAFGVWGGLLGSLLLLMRSRHAVAAYLLSIAGLAGGTAYHFALSTPPDDLEGPAMTALHLGIWAIAIALLVYAMRMRGRGVLR